MENKTSFFMMDKGSSDKKEIVVDYFLSWTLRCASEGEIRYENELLGPYCKKILSLLLFGDVEGIIDYKVDSVKTWKQWQQVDLCAEVILKKAGVDEKYALLIEDKVYTSIHDNQLARYKKIFEEEYKDTGVKTRYVFFTCQDSVSPEEQKICKENGYIAYAMDDIINLALDEKKCKLTGNPLFDEFWLSNWG